MVSTVKVILATLVIFGAGVFTGAFAVRLALFHLPQPVTASPRDEGPRLIAPNTRFNRPDFLDRLSREVHLRPEQRQRIEAILQESRQRTEPLVRGFAPKIRAEVQKVREQILEVLDPHQRARFNRLMRPRANPPRQPGRGRAQSPAANPPK